jgi:hypothetical protein
VIRQKSFLSLLILFQQAKRVCSIASSKAHSQRNTSSLLERPSVDSPMKCLAIHSSHTASLTASKKIHVDGKPVTLELWDTAGTERYQAVSRMFYRGAQSAIVVRYCGPHSLPFKRSSPPFYLGVDRDSISLTRRASGELDIGWRSCCNMRRRAACILSEPNVRSISESCSYSLNPI